MDDTIRVHVFDKGRKSLYMLYVDPLSGKQVTRSTGTSNKREADRVAGEWRAELRAGLYKAPAKITWDEFRERYEIHAVPAMAAETFGPINATFNCIERLISPRRLRDIDAAQITLWQHKLRESGLAESTIRSYSTHIRAALNWAQAQGLLPKAPKVPMPKRARKSDGRTPMKGRPILSEEFERMILMIPKVVGERRAESWRHLLDGLWLSGLRISEAAALTWDGDDFAVDMSGEHPMLRIDADHEKGNRDRYLPIAPEFAEFLMATPEDDRTGYVFRPAPHWRTQERTTLSCMKKTIGKIGKAAGVKVMEGKFRGKPHTKYASSHDLRRAFGTRWAVPVMPTVLQQLMRHESIETTLRYYVGLDAQATTKLLYEALAKTVDTSVDTPAKTTAGVTAALPKPLQK